MFKKITFLSAVIAVFLMTNTGGFPQQAQAVSFTDITENHAWAKDAIDALVSDGVIEGMDAATFAPDEQVTKEQFAKMLSLALSVETQPDAPQS